MDNYRSAIDLQRSRAEFRHERRYGDTLNAYRIIQGVVATPLAELRDFFSAGECALRLQFFLDAIDHLSKTISLSRKMDDNYFLDQAYFWRAYALIKIGEMKQAATDLALIKHIDEPFYVYSVFPEKITVDYGDGLLNSRHAPRW
jgi:hypothetical protein